MGRRRFRALGILTILAGCAEVADQVVPIDVTGKPEDGGRSADAANFDAPGDGVDASSPLPSPSPAADATDEVRIFDFGATCPPPPADPILAPHIPTRGTRLVPRLIAEKAGGLEIPAGVFDTTLNAECTPTRVADGSIRCVPDIVHVGSVFADAARTQPVVLQAITQKSLAGALVSQQPVDRGDVYDDCFPLSFGGFGRAGETNLALTVVYFENGDPVPLTAEYRTLALIPETPDFVELSEVRTRHAGAMAAREFRGTDGSRLFATRLWDTAHDVGVRNLDGAGPRALPMAQSLANVRATPPDAGSFCSADLFFRLPGCREAPRYATTFQSDVVVSIGPVTRTVYQCSFTTDAGGATMLDGSFLAACATVPLEEWRPVGVTVLGTGRLTTNAFTIEGKVFAPPLPQANPRVFFDKTLNVNCRPQVVSNGKVRCVSIDAPNPFSDSPPTMDSFAEMELRAVP